MSAARHARPSLLWRSSERDRSREARPARCRRTPRWEYPPREARPRPRRGTNAERLWRSCGSPPAAARAPEVLSPSTARLDRVKKMRGYQRCGVPHYWMVDPEDQTLTVYRWTSEGYLLILTAERGERVRTEPFGEVELEMDVLFGDEAT
ncbi:Uma2 family endonuclease [Sorangium sp. So ce394]|uniref:Uma2 family endonuclease n=1 Tax=Sorangium sp. So ce394 TaxID=3133310 RepID=UPI003F5B0D61